MKTNIIYAILGTEIMSVIICIILLIANLRETHKNSVKGTIYSKLIIINIIALVSDAVSWIFEGREDLPEVLAITTGISIVISYAIIGEYVRYIKAYLEEKKEIDRRPFVLFDIYILIAIAVTAVLCIMGKIFYYNHGCYAEGSLYTFYAIVNTLSMIFAVVVIIISRKELGRYNTAIAILYICIPVISVIFGIFIENWSFTYAATTVSLTILYTLLQSDNAENLSKEKELGIYYAMHDELTGLLSRRAYTEKIDEYLLSDSTLGVVFGDINGLKHINDNFGHREGDQLIIRFSDILRENFDDENIYRVSGDEFAVFIQGIDEKTFLYKVEALKSIIASYGNNIASLGADYGNAKEVKSLLSNAETFMYENKKIFHESHPEMIR